LNLSKERIKAAQFALMVTFFTQGVASLSWLPRVPEFIANLGVSKETWGIIIAIGGAGSLVPLVFTNRLINKYGTTPVIRFSSIGIAVFLLALPYPTQWWLFLIAHFMMSMSFSIFNIAVNSQAVMFQKRIGKVMLGSFHGAWSIGAAASAAATSAIASFTPLKVQMAVIPLLSIVLFLWSATKLLTNKEDTHGEEKVVSNPVPLFKSPKYLWVLSVGLFAGMWPELVIMDWSSVYGKEVLNLDASRAAWPYTIFMLAMIVGRFSIVKLTQKYQVNRISMVGGIFGSTAYILAFFVSSWLAPIDQNLALFFMCLLYAISGYGISSMVPSFYSAAGYVKGLSTSAALSRMFLFNTLVAIFARMFMGGLIDNFSLLIALTFPMATFVIATVISGLVANRQKRIDQVLAYAPTSPITSLDVAD
jgi:predicted MFS family arabinose efflux permease